jgi:hypothetical protein
MMASSSSLPLSRRSALVSAAAGISVSLSPTEAGNAFRVSSGDVLQCILASREKTWFHIPSARSLLTHLRRIRAGTEGKKARGRPCHRRTQECKSKVCRCDDGKHFFCYANSFSWYLKVCLVTTLTVQRTHTHSLLHAINQTTIAGQR